jgi:phage terminase large subunit-like protein
MDKERLKELRYKARTDLYWLAKNLLDNKDLIERVHRPVCEFFVHKDRSRSFADQDTSKERLLLDPRGHFKTTLDVADCFQWIINFPDIRILIMTGKRELAELMLRQLKEHFQFNPKVRELFPEFCPPMNADFGNTTEFSVPNRKGGGKEPTVMISSGESVKAGFHFDIIKCDDLVNETNVGTPEQVQKTINIWNYTTPLLEPYGYRDTIGTRYDHSDLYGFLQESDDSIKVFQRKCGDLTRTPDGKYHLTNLLFPERFNEEWLLKQQKKDPYIFNCQYMNDPSPTEDKQFTEALLKAHTIPLVHCVNNLGRTFITWDLGISQKSQADFTVGAVGRFDGMGRLFIVDLVMGRFSPFEIVQEFFKLLLKWKPVRVGIEEAAGSPLLLPALHNFARDNRIYLPLDWIPTRNTKGHKVEKVMGLEALLRQDKLYFSASLPNMDELIKQFVRFPKYRHDDVPDAISMLMNYRSNIDMEIYEKELEFVSTPVTPGCEVLGAGLIG